MKIIKGLHGLKALTGGSVVTVGVFDGVHIGHARVIGKMVARAKELGLKSVVVTFDPHPSKVLNRATEAPSLISLDHRLKLIKELSPDLIVVLRFTKALACLTPEQFVKKILIEKISAREAYVGENFYFGNKACAGVKELQALGKPFGLQVHVVKALKVDGKRVSSSLIRTLIARGELKRAAYFLGRPVSVLGTVISGANLARQLGYPTANLNPHHEVVPPSGVYAVLVKYASRVYAGILNIGVRPTFYAPRDREKAIEVHIFAFRRNIYGRVLEVFFVRKIRDERAFAGRNELIEQIKNDEKAALTLARGSYTGRIKKLLTY